MNTFAKRILTLFLIGATALLIVTLVPATANAQMRVRKGLASVRTCLTPT